VQQGTSVIISNLFANIPVRRKTFERNAKKDFASVQALLHAYALICDGVRFSLSNTDVKGCEIA
jgi:DNA mismatch repair protein PMS2